MLNMPILHAQRDARRPMKSARLRRHQQLGELRLSLGLLTHLLGFIARLNYTTDPSKSGGHFLQGS